MHAPSSVERPKERLVVAMPAPEGTNSLALSFREVIDRRGAH